MTSPLTGKLRAIQQYINHGDDDDDNDQSVFLFYSLFRSIALETLGPLDPSALDFLRELCWRLSAATGDVRETAFLFQRLSVVIQRYNSVLIYESFHDLDLEPDL